MSPQIIAADGIPPALLPIITAICTVSRSLSRIIERGAIGRSLDAGVGQNADGDAQKTLDLLADNTFVVALRGKGLRWYLSEEQDDVLPMDADGHFALAIDPLDGSSNIDVNVSIGTIFSITPALAWPDASFLRPGDEQIAAGYVIYGPQTALIVTFGQGVRAYVLFPDTTSFVLVNPDLRIPATASEFAINASNYRRWLKPVRADFDDCVAGDTGPRGHNFNMRWVASLVAETHRILTRGGILLYPSDTCMG